MQQATRNTLGDLFGYIPSAIVPTALGFVAVAVYTRILPPEEYGLYTLVFTTVLFTHTFAFSWLNQATIRYYKRYGSTNIQTFFSTGLFGFLTIALVVLIVWYAMLSAGYLFRGLRLWKLLLFGPLVVLFYSGGNFILAYLRASRQSIRYSLLTSLNALLKLLSSLALIYYLGFDAEAILLGIAFGGACIFIPECIRLSKNWKPKIRKFDYDILRSSVKYGFPLVGLAVANVILSSSDRYLIEYFLDSTQVGIYSAGYRITQTGVMLFVTFLMLASFPALIETFERSGEKKAQLLMYDLLSIFFVLLLPVFAGISVLSKDIVNTVLGVSYYKAYVIVPWTAAGVFFMGLCMYYNKSFELKEKTSLLLVIFGAASLLNIVLNIVLIPWLGILGATISTFISYLVCFLLSLSIGSNFIVWLFPWKTSVKALLGSSIMALVLIILPDLRPDWLSLLYKISIGFMVYVTIILLFDRMLFEAVISLFRNRLKISPRF